MFFFCLTVIMDMSGGATETADRPSGSILPPCPVAAARVRTTSTAQGKDCMIFSSTQQNLSQYILIYHHIHKDPFPLQDTVVFKISWSTCQQQNLIYFPGLGVIIYFPFVIHFFLCCAKQMCPVCSFWSLPRGQTPRKA